MADRLRWHPTLPSLAGKTGGRAQQTFVDIFAPGQAPAFLTPLEEVGHDNYRILTIESRYCTFCARSFPHPTGLRKHLNEGTVQCKKAQLAQRNGSSRFVFFGWKHSQGSVDPAVRRPIMHTKYAKLEELEALEHPQKELWLAKVFPIDGPPPTPVRSTSEVTRSRVRSPSQPVPVQVMSPVARVPSVTPTAAVAADAHQTIPHEATPEATPAANSPALIHGDSVASSDSESGDETPATHYIPSIHLPAWEDGFATVPFHQPRMLPHDVQGFVTPLRRDRSFFKHFLMVELEVIRATNPEYFNAPASEAEEAMRRRSERPLHISSPASPYINKDFIVPNDPNGVFYEWYADHILKSERYPDGSLRMTAENSPSMLSSPWARNINTDFPPPEILAMFGAGGQLEPQQPILPPYTIGYSDQFQFPAALSQPAPNAFAPEAFAPALPFDGATMPNSEAYNGWNF